MFIMVLETVFFKGGCQINRGLQCFANQYHFSQLCLSVRQSDRYDALINPFPAGKNNMPRNMSVFNPVHLLDSINF